MGGTRLREMRTSLSSTLVAAPMCRPPIDDVTAFVGCDVAATGRHARRVRISILVVQISIVALVVAAAADRWLRITTFESVPTAPVPVTSLFAPSTSYAITVTAGAARAPWVTTDEELLGSVELWKRMHLQDWDAVPAPLREKALDNLLRRYQLILNNPVAWDQMDRYDWDAVPQPVRTVAYRRMIAYWTGLYDVGAAFQLPPWVVADTLSAIIMSESWFDQRAQSMNRDGTVDLGLAQASPYARERLRELHASGRVDASLNDDEYLDPWMATRFVALWMKLMIEETNGDLDMAVRAYNRGLGDAADRLGARYLSDVQRRLRRFIRNSGAPPSWDYVWRASRVMTAAGRP
jgi:hypothetical protein